MKVLVHSFDLTDCDDPEIYAAEPIWAWQQSEQGKWVMEHSEHQPSWTIALNPLSYSYQVNIVADLEGIDLTYFCLKWK